MIHVVIPIYNAFEALQRCVASLFKHADTASPCRVMLIDDASTDPRVAPWLASLASAPALQLDVLHNAQNLGFVGTVNRAMALSDDDVVLLNADTEVTAGWLAALQKTADSDARIGTVTPLSNNGEIASYPVFCGNTLADEVNADAIATAARQAFSDTGSSAPDLPTGVGFCLFIRRAALQAVGLFDADRFGRGYGEENDFCLRLAGAGFRNVLCPACYVVHLGSASFLDSAGALKRENLQRLLNVYPDYESAIASFIAERPLQSWHDAIAAELAASGRDAYGHPKRPGVLVITHDYGGGVEQHVRDLAQLLCKQRRVDILYPGQDGSVVLEDEHGHRLGMTRADGKRVLRERSYSRLHFHHVHGHAADILELASHLQLPYDVTLHDFAAFCPQYALSTPEGRYCGQPNREGCHRCVSERPHTWRWDIDTWRARWKSFLENAARVIAPSQFVAEQIARHLPDLCVQVHAHPPRHAWVAEPQPSVKVLILGGLSVTKGLERVVACARLAKQQGLPLSFVVLGYTQHAIPTSPELPIHVVGEYDDADLPRLAALERADLVWFPGQIPETYSYTLDIALNLGLPVVATDIGAIAQRLAVAGHPTHHRVDNNASPIEWVRVLMSVVPQSPHASGDTPARRLAEREAYRELLCSQGSSTPATQTYMVQPLGWQRPDTTPVAPPAPAAQRSLQSLFEHGVLAGHRASREALRLRLDDVSRLEKDLRAIETREGLPWYEHMDLLQRKSAQLDHDHQRLLSDFVRMESHLHAELNEAHRAYGSRIHAFETSLSWRLTAPLRDVKKALRDLLHRLPGSVQRGARLLKRWPTAVQMWREHGLLALLRRTHGKLFPTHPPATSASMAALIAIQPLVLNTCPPNETPRVSIVIPTYGQHLHTFNCLYSLQAHTALRSVEIILLDDAAPEPLSTALPDVNGVHMYRNATNLGFIGSCAAGAAKARGDFLLMLNNDVQVTAGWLDAMLAVFENHPDTGLVGARLVYPDGRLQEAGGIVWRDGSAWNWGRFADPEHPHFRYVRQVDYCSGACLLIRRTDWDALGGFDTAYTPAYYEDTDIAFRIRARGLAVYYQPEAHIVHHEGISSGTDTGQGVKRYQVINQKTFFARWEDTLKSHRINGEAPRLEADRKAVHRVLIVEACMITPDQDSGSIRMLAILELLIELGCKVAFVADNLEHRQPYVRQLQQLGVEVWHAPHVTSVAELLRNEGRVFSHIMFCRHYIAAPYVALAREHAPQARLLFDTVDLHFLREQRQADLEQSAALRHTAEKTRRQELAVIRAVDITLVVSPVERELLVVEAPSARVEVLSNIHEPVPHTPGFAQREGLLFVGGFQHPPNIDAVRWFLQEVWPLVHAQRPETVVRIVGSKMPDSLKALSGPGIEILGFVQDLDPLLASSKISIAPLRYGAGVKGKINQAMAHGLPVVATGVAVEGMYLQEGTEVLTGDDAESFAQAILTLCDDETLWQRLASEGKCNIERTFSRAVARTALQRVLEVPVKA